MIMRNTRIPCSKQDVFSTVFNNQTSVLVRVLQGESHLSKNNTEIGSFTIKGIPPAPAGVEKRIVTFSIDMNGCLNVTAFSKSNPNNVKGQITIEKQIVMKKKKSLICHLKRFQMILRNKQCELYKNLNNELIDSENLKEKMFRKKKYLSIYVYVNNYELVLLQLSCVISIFFMEI